MGAAAGHRHRPAAGAAPRDRAHVDAPSGRRARVFEIERDVGLPAFGDEVAAGDRNGLPASSSSPVRNTVMLAFFSVPAACMARSAATITAIPPLSSPAPGRAPSSPSRCPALERRIGLEHRVEMRDQQQPLAVPAAGVPGDEMAGAAGRRHVDPLRS